MSVGSDSEEAVSEWEEDSERVPLQLVVEQETETDGEDSDGTTGKKSQLLSRVKNSWRRVLTLVCLFIASLLTSIAFSNISPFLPAEVEKKGFGTVVTGVIIGCSPLMVVIFSPIFGYLVPYLGFRSMISLGLVLIGGSYVLMGFSDLLPSSWIFVVYMASLRLCEGIGSALYSTTSFAVLPVLFPNSVATTTGILEVSIALGLTVGFLIGGILYQFGGFRLPFLAVGVSVLASILPCTLLVKGKGNTKEHPASFKLIFRFFSDPVIIILLVGFILTSSSMFFIYPSLQPFFWREFHLESVQVGLAFIILPVAYLVSVIFAGPLSDIFGYHVVIIFGLLLGGVGFLLIGPAEFISNPRLWLTCTSLGIIGLAGALGTVPVYADLVSIARKKGNEEESAALTSIVSGVVSSTLSLGSSLHNSSCGIFGVIFAGPLSDIFDTTMFTVQSGGLFPIGGGNFHDRTKTFVPFYSGCLGPMVGGGLAEGLSFPASSLVYGEVLLAQASMLAGVTLIERYTRLKPKPSHS